jgi:hypothetical protein
LRQQPDVAIRATPTTAIRRSSDSLDFITP